MRLRLLLSAIPLALLFAPAAASASGGACAKLPATVSLSSSDPTVLRDDPQAIVRAKGGARLRDVRVTLTRKGRRYGGGLLTGRLARGRIAVPLRLTAGRRVGAGEYRLVVSASRAGCGRRTMARIWKFGTPSLPVRAAPISTLVSDNRNGVKLLLRSVDRQTVSGVRVSLLDAAGATVAQTTHAGAFTGQIDVDLPLAGALPAGSYTLRVTGRSAGASSVSEQKLAFAAGSSDAATTTTTATTGLIEQHATVDWSGGAWQGRDVAGFVAPGIGYGEIVCRPDAQWIRFYPNDLGREVSMMNWTYKDWSQNTEKAIREAQHTQYTGKDFREGLNKFGPAEKRSTGEFDGLISDRGAHRRGRAGGPGRAHVPEADLAVGLQPVGRRALPRRRDLHHPVAGQRRRAAGAFGLDRVARERRVGRPRRHRVLDPRRGDRQHQLLGRAAGRAQPVDRRAAGRDGDHARGLRRHRAAPGDRPGGRRSAQQRDAVRDAGRRDARDRLVALEGQRPRSRAEQLLRRRPGDRRRLIRVRADFCPVIARRVGPL